VKLRARTAKDQSKKPDRKRGNETSFHEKKCGTKIATVRNWSGNLPLEQIAGFEIEKRYLKTPAEDGAEPHFREGLGGPGLGSDFIRER